MPGTEAGEDYDYYISDSVAKTAEMTYSSVQDDYGQGKNYIPSLKLVRVFKSIWHGLLMKKILRIYI